MARRLSRKLVDVETLQQLADIQRALTRHKITNSFQLFASSPVVARVMVPLGELEAARRVLAALQQEASQ